MTILAYTSEYLVEYESGQGGGLLTIARHMDGHCKGLTGRGIAGQFRDCLKTHSPAKAVEVFLKMAKSRGWAPLYTKGGTHMVAGLYDVEMKD